MLRPQEEHKAIVYKPKLTTTKKTSEDMSSQLGKWENKQLSKDAEIQ